MEEFKVGDIVQLKSGSPKMTVVYIHKDSVRCQWFAGNILEEGYFSNQSIVIFVEEKKEKGKN